MVHKYTYMSLTTCVTPQDNIDSHRAILVDAPYPSLQSCLELCTIIFSVKVVHKLMLDITRTLYFADPPVSVYVLSSHKEIPPSFTLCLTSHRHYNFIDIAFNIALTLQFPLVELAFNMT